MSVLLSAKNLSYTDVGYIIGVILSRIRAIGRGIRQQQSTSIKARGESRNNGIRLSVASRREWSRGVAEDISTRGFLESTTCSIVESAATIDLSLDVREAGLGVDCQWCGLVFAVDCDLRVSIRIEVWKASYLTLVDIVGPVGRKPIRMQSDARVRTQRS